MCVHVQVGSYSSCSAAVEAAMSGDVMRSVLVLVEDLLDALPVLLYQVGLAFTDAPYVCVLLALSPLPRGPPQTSSQGEGETPIFELPLPLYPF